MHVFEDVMTEVIPSNILRFPCPKHAGELLLSAITYYIRLRMQQYTSQMNKNNKKQNQLKKSKLNFALLNIIIKNCILLYFTRFIFVKLWL